VIASPLDREYDYRLQEKPKKRGGKKIHLYARALSGFVVKEERSKPVSLGLTVRTEGIGERFRKLRPLPL